METEDYYNEPVYSGQSFSEKERLCEQHFASLGKIFHLSSPEDFELICATTEDFRSAMTILAICSIRFFDIRLLTFQILSNHIHICLAGDENEIRSFFKLFRKYYGRYLSGIGRPVDLSNWEPDIRPVPDLSYARNVVVYDNRNGFVVRPSVTPFSYPWGAGRFYFSPDAKIRHKESNKTLKCRKYDY